MVVYGLFSYAFYCNCDYVHGTSQWSIYSLYTAFVVDYMHNFQDLNKFA